MCLDLSPDGRSVLTGGASSKLVKVTLTGRDGYQRENSSDFSSDSAHTPVAEESLVIDSDVTLPTPGT
jgi:hypothetical protein